jgi:hypothetical protein
LHLTIRAVKISPNKRAYNSRLHPNTTLDTMVEHKTSLKLPFQNGILLSCSPCDKHKL